MTRAVLEMLGRQARWALPIGVVLGIAWPALASLMRPLLTAAVVATLTATLIRLDWQALARHARQPLLPALIAVVLLIASPLIAWQLTSAFGMAAAVGVALILQCSAPPVGSAAAFALMTGINGERVLVVTVLTTLLLPLTLTPLVATVLSAYGVQIDLVPFFLRVCLLVALPFALAIGIRRLVGVARLQRNDKMLSGLNVVFLVVFAVAIMDGAGPFILRSPAQALWLIFLSFLMAVLLHLIAYLAFRWHSHETGLVAALSIGNRNMGLTLAITAGSAGDIASLYFGFAQIPMYCVPLLLAPFVSANPQRR